MRTYIGLTGLSGTGKDTVANTLASLVQPYGIHVYRYNLSDEIRDEIARRGIARDKISRLMLIETGNELRTTYGDGILASLIVARDLKVCSSGDQKPALVTIAGIRNPHEVITFRREWRDRFILGLVEAPREVRSLRLASRQQYQEDVDFSNEIEEADQAIGIETCAQMADWRIQNSGSIDQLQAEVRLFFYRCVAPTLGVRDTAQ